MLVTWAGPGAVAWSDLWCLTLSMLHCMVLPAPASTLCNGVWIWVRAAAWARQIWMRTPLWGVSRRTEFSHMDVGCAIKPVLRGRELAPDCFIFYSKAGLLVSVPQCQALRQNAFTAVCIQDVILMLGSCCKICHSELQEDCLCPQNLKLE